MQRLADISSAPCCCPIADLPSEALAGPCAIPLYPVSCWCTPVLHVLASLFYYFHRFIHFRERHTQGACVQVEAKGRES